MKQAPWIEIHAPIAARARYLAEAYDDILSDSGRLRRKLGHLVAHRGSAVVEHWFRLIAQGDRLGLTAALAEQHYDPAYAKSMRAVAPEVTARFDTPSLSGVALEHLADRIAAHVQSASLI